MRRTLILMLSGCLGLCGPASAADNPFLKPKQQTSAADVLPAEKALVFQGAKKVGKNVELRWNVLPGYYLYRHMFKVTVDAPAGLAAPTLALPLGERRNDAEFGDVEVYTTPITARFALPEKGPMPNTIRVRYQGCAEVGLCYPPQTKIVAIK